MIFDVSERDFQARVVDRSRELPVVVDFWAEWCGPCRALTPALEAAARSREGQVDLAKLDVDANQTLAAAFRVQGIPSVKAFRDGQVAEEFTGALPPPQVEAFFNRLVPSEADAFSERDDEASLRRALEIDPSHVDAARKLGRLLVRRGEDSEAEAVLAPFDHDYVAAGLAERARLARSNGSAPGSSNAAGATSDTGERLRAAFEAWDAGEHARALELLQEAIRAEDPDRRDALRRIMVAIFTELGPDSTVAREHRRRLAAALN